MADNKLDSYVHRLIEQEEAIQELYETYAAFLPDHRHLWNTLSRQESSHAGILRSLHTEMVTGGVTFNPASLHRDNIDQAIDFMNKCCNDCTNGRTDINSALKAAIFLETSLIENHFFDCFDTMSPKIKEKLSAIRLQTMEHLKLVENYSKS